MRWSALHCPAKPHLAEQQATLQVTYPLDTLRLRMAVDPTTRSVPGVVRTLFREGSYGAFFRGLGPSLLGVAVSLASASHVEVPIHCLTAGTRASAGRPTTSSASEGDVNGFDRR